MEWESWGCYKLIKDRVFDLSDFTTNKQDFDEFDEKMSRLNLMTFVVVGVLLLLSIIILIIGLTSYLVFIFSGVLIIFYHKRCGMMEKIKDEYMMKCAKFLLSG